MEAHVRMGEAAVSKSIGDVLACVGLGSCIGLGLFDRTNNVAGLAHVMLPASPGPNPPQPGKYANLAVPALVETVVRSGANRARLEAVMVGGSGMFAMGNGATDIGTRNAEAVAAALKELRIPVRCRDTGGSRGRTIRIEVSPQMVTVLRAAGGTDEQIYGAGTPLTRRPVAA